MNYTIFFVLLLVSTISCKPSAKNNLEEQVELMQVEPKRQKTAGEIQHEAYEIFQKDSTIISKFWVYFQEACKDRPVNFVFDTLEQSHRFGSDLNVDLSKNPDLEFSRYYKFRETQNKMNSQIAVDLYHFKDESYSLTSKKLIDVHSDAYRKAQLQGKEVEFLETHTTYFKIPAYIFRINNTIFEVQSTCDVSHIMTAAFSKLKEEYNIQDEDIIPNERKYLNTQENEQIKKRIKDWLDFYKLDLRMFYKDLYDSSPLMNTAFDDYPLDIGSGKGSTYDLTYDKERHDVYDPIANTYSPDKQYEVGFPSAAGVGTNWQNMTQYVWRNSGNNTGTEEIFMTNHKQQKNNCLYCLYDDEKTDAVFWMGNHTVVFVGRFINEPAFFIKAFGKYGGFYKYRTHDKMKSNVYDTYFMKNIKSRGVIVED